MTITSYYCEKVHMKKILIVITTAFVPYGGISTVVLNYYRAIDKKDIEIDIASTNMAPQILIDELKENSSRYFCLGRRSNCIAYIRNLKRVLKNGYDAIHVNGNSSTMILELLPAKMQKVPLRIAHVHTTKSNYPLLSSILRPLFAKTYNNAVAVSNDAGKWLFGDGYTVLNNAINTEKYTFSMVAREKIRKELNIPNSTFVVGNVGKLNYPKNHQYLVRVFAKVHNRLPDSKLLIVGGGELESQLRDQVKELKLEDAVIFTGMVNDASEYLQAFDFFAFPSRFEGLGLALIEAQASGLRCIISNKVPKEAIVSDNVQIIGIDEKETQGEWAEYILDNALYNRETNSIGAMGSIRAHGYDISTEANKLRSIYYS